MTFIAQSENFRILKQKKMLKFECEYIQEISVSQL